MQRFKLAHVLLDVEDFLVESPEAFYRAEPGSSCEYDETSGELKVTGLVDFTTYFNGISMRKWRRYAGIDDVVLHVEIAGDACTLAVMKLIEGEGDEIESEVAEILEIDEHAQFEAFEIEMPSDAVVAGFAIMAEGAVRIRNAYFVTEIDESRINPVRLALCTTTFRKEDFIVPNIERIKEGVLAGDDPIAANFHMFVVDNGRTLDAERLADENVTVIPNPNVGGAGGFARGMMAAQDDARGFTHVILMDDDVRMSVESFKRTYALLSLVTGEYKRACINGAMIELERPWLLYEDVAYVRSVGGYDRIKNDTRITDAAAIARNELVDVESVPGCRTYGAWWYSCIPMELVRENGLPMPFFVRCDDVEYGTRMNTKYMAMNGICVWHARFAARFNASVACYQYVRNMLITMALHNDFFDQRIFLVRFWRTFHHLLRTMDYDSAGLWLDGLEDYLKGPEFLMRADGAALLKEKGAAAEKLVPLAEIDQDLVRNLRYDSAWLERGEGYVASPLKKALLTVPHDHHWFPDFLLSNEPGVIAPGFENYSDWRTTAMRTRLVALSTDEKSAHVRELDRARYRELSSRFRSLVKAYRSNGAEIAAHWREKMPEMTSLDFWESYIEARSDAER